MVSSLAATPIAEPHAPPAERRSSIVGDLRVIVRELIDGRDLLLQLTMRDIRIRYKQALFGFGWAVLMPVVTVLAGILIRTALAHAANLSFHPTQLAGMMLKAVPWAFFIGCLNTATPSLLANKTLVTKIYFPREVLPIAAILAQSFDTTIGLGIVAVALPFFGVHLSVTMLWVPLLLVLLWALAAASAVFLSCANLFFRDVKYLVQVFVTFGVFMTPVLLDAAMFGARIGPVVMLNPIAPILEGLRLSVVDHHNLLEPMWAAAGPGRPPFLVWRPWYIGYSAAWAFGGLLVALIVFHRSERQFAEIV